MITIDEIIKTFEIIQDKNDKYDYLIDLGHSLPQIPEEYKNDNNKLKGCQSNVWININFKDNKSEISMDSDSVMVKGILQILLSVYNNKTKEEIKEIDIEVIIKKLDLDNLLSSNRKTGLQSAIDKIKSI